MTDENREAIEILLADRELLYSLLHKMVGRDPDQEMLDVLFSPAVCDAFRILSTEPGDAMEQAAGFLENWRDEKRSQEALDEIRAEYVRTYIGPGKLPAPPWESVYFGEDSVLFQECTLKVREAYRTFDLLPAGYPHVPDDSLALELGFLAELARRSCSAFAEGNNEKLKKDLTGSQNFLTGHLLVWMPRYLERMDLVKTKLFYPQMSAYLFEFLKRDREILDEILSCYN